jgi:O-acetyl-ADP-ribose deacetylase (regulator of RNase III)
MDYKVKNSFIKLIQGDITQQTTQAIVNAANQTLLGGGGVDGAIHSAGGPAILAECRKLNGCETGDAKITTGGNLKARYVIHTVGPVWHGGKSKEDTLLKSAYQRSLETAEENQVVSVSFPSISTGVYRFPIDRASKIAIGTVVDFLKGDTGIKEVDFVLFSAGDFKTYEETIKGFV